jgi:hypothetical protein
MMAKGAQLSVFIAEFLLQPPDRAFLSSQAAAWQHSSVSVSTPPALNHGLRELRAKASHG